MKKYILSLLFSLFAISIFSQINKFSPIEEEFIKELETFMESSFSKEKEVHQTSKEFIEVFMAGTYSAEQKKKIIETCNFMLKKRAKPYPNFYSFLGSLIAFSNHSKMSEIYSSWINGYTIILKNKNIRYANAYCTQTISLLLEKKLYQSASVEWKLATDNYRYTIKDNYPYVEIYNNDLISSSKGDSTVIKNTNGYADPIKYSFEGTGGTIGWERAGFSRDQTHATFSKYHLNLKSSSFRADSVEFLNLAYYPEPMLGSLVEKILANVDSSRATYPRFDSYQSIFEIKDIYPEVDYRGGFSQHGAKFIGSGNKDIDANLYFYKDGQLSMKCSSKLYVFKTDNIIGKNVASVYYFEGDSIYHPGLLLKYYVKKREINLIRDDDPKSMSRSPFFNSYHKIDMDFEQLTWSMDSSNVNMGRMFGSNVSKANFESSDYFRESRYNEIWVDDNVHPLVALRRYAAERGSEEFYLEEFAGYLHQSLTNTRHMCLALSYRGLIEYDIASEKISIKERLHKYLKSRVGKVDYDVIQLESQHDLKDVPNAKLDLESMDLQLYGVPRVQVSDSQNVTFFPRGRQLKVKQDRDFEFDGVIDAGLFTFYGEEFYFGYKDFKIDLDSIDSLKIKVQSFEEDEYGVKQLVEVNNVIENVTGYLLIDDPENKSSVKNFPQYPIFSSNKESYIYYDQGNIQNGVYDRERFYFAIEPYELDSLNSFRTNSLSFTGKFVSAGIFPDFDETLEVQDDYSLGFTRISGSDGYPVYGGKGTFYDTVNMSNQGLIGSGKVVYLNSYAYSKEFIFLPDSMNALAESYQIEEQMASEGVEYPTVEALDVNIHWEPYNDLWETEQNDSAIYMYDRRAKLFGGLEFSPTGLTGWGDFVFGDAQISSDNFVFKQAEVFADSSDFALLSDSTEFGDMAIKTSNINAYVNFNEERADFKSNDLMTVVEFPQNKYIAYLDGFSWDMKEEKIDLGSTVEIEDPTEGMFIGSQFFSMKPSQDTLNFIAPDATYDLDSFKIRCMNVPFIRVADGIVYPGEEGKITIVEDAEMEPLKDARIVTNDTSRYHEMYNVDVKISGRYEYEGKGKIDFVNALETLQTIELERIYADTTDTAVQTIANGVIPLKDSFLLSPEFRFYGDVTLYASEKDLSFNGGAQIMHACPSIGTHWIYFDGKIDPFKVMVPIGDTIREKDGGNLYTAIYQTLDSAHVYPAFFSRRKRERDMPMVEAKGYLTFDPVLGNYKVASKEKIARPDTAGNMIALQKDFCVAYSEGSIDYGVDLGQVKIESYGSITHNIQESVTDIEASVALDFFFAPSLLKPMADTIGNNSVLANTDLTTELYPVILNNILVKEDADKLMEEISLYGQFKKLPDEMEHTIFLSNVNLQWDTVGKAFRSVGQIGVGNILSRTVNKTVDGYVEIAKRRSGDRVVVLLEISDRDWYFFSYQAEVMSAYSTDSEFNSYIEDQKEKKRKVKTKRKEAKYVYEIGSEEMKDIFIRRFKNEIPEEDFVEDIDIDDDIILDDDLLDDDILDDDLLDDDVIEEDTSDDTDDDLFEDESGTDDNMMILDDLSKKERKQRDKERKKKEKERKKKLEDEKSKKDKSEFEDEFDPIDDDDLFDDEGTPDDSDDDLFND